MDLEKWLRPRSVTAMTATLAWWLFWLAVGRDLRYEVHSRVASRPTPFAGFADSMIVGVLDDSK